MPYSGLYHFYKYELNVTAEWELVSMPYSGLYHFYPTLLRASIYAGLRAGFCTYFSELSEF